ncbi:MAG TPA: transglutaminaseTgpA domain-containing protein, partial [Kofleriaceae bacterium]|nr:transglutaminaseTgpA domain-containing protein [Kofleriaceae bacterium]
VRLERWSLLWSIGSIIALVYSVLTAITSADFLGVGAEFLIWLIVAKAFNRRAARDWQQMYLLAFLMLVAGSVLNPDLTYGACFLGFVIASTWALTLFHLRREMEDNLLVKHAADRASERVEVRRILDSRRIVNGRFFLGTGALSFAVFLGAALVFLALPRVGVGFFLKARGGLTLAGFSDGVKLGGHGVIKNDATVVMRIEISSRFGGRDAPEIHWRGVAFDHYEAGQWSRQSDAPKTLQTLEQSATRDRRYLRWDGAPLTSPAIDELSTRLVKQDIWLDPLDSDVLFGASTPRIVEYVHTLRPRRTPSERNDEVRLDHGSTVHYTAWSQLTPPPPELLRAATGNLPEGYGVYIQLPREITPRTRELARRITAGLTTEFDKVEAIKSWLINNLSYTLVLAEPGKQEPVDFFLFDRKKGHCEYFASAFAVLARAVAIPTRQVNGFLGGEWNEYQSYVAVRAGDAHSWDEVYYPGAGWVTVDPTPPGDVDALGRGGRGWTARLGRFLDTLRFQWNKWVIEYDLVSQLALFRQVGGALQTVGSAIKRVAGVARTAAVDHWAVALALAAAIAAAIALRRRRRRRPGVRVARHRPRPRVRSPIGEIYDDVARALARSGVPREAAVTPRELAQRMAARGEGVAPQLGELTELYYAAEWGRRHDPAAEQRAADLARQIREALRATASAARRASR